MSDAKRINGRKRLATQPYQKYSTSVYDPPSETIACGWPRVIVRCGGKIYDGWQIGNWITFWEPSEGWLWWFRGLK